jgi:hypothetical protein
LTITGTAAEAQLLGTCGPVPGKAAAKVPGKATAKAPGAPATPVPAAVPGAPGRPATVGTGPASEAVTEGPADTAWAVPTDAVGVWAFAAASAGDATAAGAGELDASGTAAEAALAIEGT